MCSVNNRLRFAHLSTRKALVAVGLSCAVLFGATACGFNSAQPVQSADTTVLAPKDVASKVPVTADIASAESTALTTHLTGPVKNVNVRVGQRVEAGQVVAVMDTSSVQREIDSQQAQQLTANAAAQNQVEQAQQQYQQFNDALQRGLNPQVTQAQAALAQAESALQDANAVFEERKAAVARGLDAGLLNQGQAVDNARRDLLTAAIDTVRNNLGIFNSAMESTDPFAPLLGKLDADHRYSGANTNLNAAQKSYDAALNEVDVDLAAKQRAVAQAFRAKAEAAVGLEVAQLAAQQQLDTHAAAVAQAQRGLAASQNAGGQAISQLQVDVASGEVRAPLGGVVTEVAAKQGQPAQGYLLSVANPERMVLRAKVKESDSGKIAPGDEVSFTTPSTGMKKFKGRVVDVSAVAAPQGPAAGGEAGSAGASSRPEFPVEIEVLGDKQGLKLGGTAKVQIVTDAAKGALAVPREAVVDENGEYSVYSLRQVKGDEYEVVKTPVQVGLISDFEVVVTGEGIDEGTRVLNKPADFRERVGQHVTVVEG